MSTERTLERIDGEHWDQWDGHSPDAARWDGDDWIDERRPVHASEYVAPPDDSERAREWADEVNRQLAFGRRYV